MEDKPTIKQKNLKIWLKDQFKRKTWFRNFFITRNAWGAFSINSHINQHTRQPKITYNTLKTALKSAEVMSKNIILILALINVFSVTVIIQVKIWTIKQIMIKI